MSSRLMNEVEDPSPLDYNATLNRMEPGIAPVAEMISLASIAISLKDIALTLHRLEGASLQNSSELRSIASSLSTSVANMGNLANLNNLNRLKRG